MTTAYRITASQPGRQPQTCRRLWPTRAEADEQARYLDTRYAAIGCTHEVDPVEIETEKEPSNAR